DRLGSYFLSRSYVSSAGNRLLRSLSCCASPAGLLAASPVRFGACRSRFDGRLLFRVWRGLGRVSSRGRPPCNQRRVQDMAQDAGRALNSTVNMLSRLALTRLCRARDMLREISDRHLSIHDVAREAAMSPFHFIRQFEALFGETP